MTAPKSWPFGTDADRDDPLTALRVPVVGSFNPQWKYIAAYLKPVTGGPDYLKGPPFGSNERPTDHEARMIASFIQEYLQHWFREGYQRKLAERALDVDSGANTTVFIKYGPNDWGYRLCSWISGPTFVPEPPTFADRKPGPLTLEQVMDRRHTIGSEEPMKHWLNWKTAHPETFPALTGTAPTTT
ncbi:hypothetical protein AB0L71_28345 [Streptomyces sp. NPDC052052]|uniref:hypothetical protein n=1 Tax=Streptomyces sp. NPDC052052 TaxID=3154756 RepID=UPI0034349534